MANNRIYFVCIDCEANRGERTFGFDDIDRPWFGVAKWYPGSAWYANRETNDSFTEWMKRHSHDNHEYPFRFEYEVPEKKSDGAAK